MVRYMRLEEQVDADFAPCQSEGVLPAVDGQFANRARLRLVPASMISRKSSALVVGLASDGGWYLVEEIAGSVGRWSIRRRLR